MGFVLPRMMPRFGGIEEIERLQNPWAVSFVGDSEFTASYATFAKGGVPSVSPLLGLPMSRAG